MSTTRLVVADDHRSFAAALSSLLELEPDLEVVETVHDGDDAAAAVRRHDPDVLVIDVDLGRRNGLHVAAEARRSHPELAVVVVTAHGGVDVACAAVRAGATGFITKDAAPDDLVAAIRGGARGESHMAPLLLTGVLRELQRPDAGLTESERRLATLTEREHEILGCLEEGLDRAGIARRLFLSVHTVRTHTRNLLAKLHVHSSLEAVAVARRARDARRDRGA